MNTDAHFSSKRLRALLCLLAISAITGCGETAVNDNPPGNTPVAATMPLNDTGIIFGRSDPDGNNADCSGASIGQQDCSHGRDMTQNDNSDGHAGFSFTKLDGNGDELPASAEAWSCVRDNVTGLIWEVKQQGDGNTGNGGLHDADDLYTWYNTNPDTNGGANGDPNADGADCYGYDATDPATYCNTQAFVARVNAAGLCGKSAWRLPTRLELVNLANFNHRSNPASTPAIDVAYFPNTTNGAHWSSSLGSFLSIGVVLFADGSFYPLSDRSLLLSARLVHDGS